MTQKQRILRALENAGQDGLVASDFMVNPADGGAPILRVAARVHDLRTDGHVIRGSWDSQMSQERYVLISQPGLVKAHAQEVVVMTSPGGLSRSSSGSGDARESSEGLFDTALFDTPTDHYMED